MAIELTDNQKQLLRKMPYEKTDVIIERDEWALQRMGLAKIELNYSDSFTRTPEGDDYLAATDESGEAELVFPSPPEDPDEDRAYQAYADRQVNGEAR